ncbi:hypothetical protein Tco_0765548 [Tanacetum coccineum]
MVVQNQPQPPTITLTPTTFTQTPTPDQPTTSIQPSQLQKSIRKPTRKDTEELMEVCTNLQRRVLTLEETKTTQDAEIIYEADLGDQEDASKQGRKIDDIDADIDVTLVNDVVNDDEMFDVDFLNDAEQYVDDVEVTLAQTLVEIKSTKPKVEGIVIQDPSATTTTTVSSQQAKIQDKGK